MERGGRLPVKDSVETREGLIFIRMTDPRVRRERPTWQHGRVIQLSTS